MIRITDDMGKGFAVGVYSTIVLNTVLNAFKMGFAWPVFVSIAGFIVVIIHILVRKEGVENDDSTP